MNARRHDLLATVKATTNQDADRDLAASLHSSDLPLPAPELIAEDEDEDEDDIILIEEAAEESEEDALARAIAEEKELEA